MSKAKRKLPRGEYRPRWGMYHEPENFYNRKKGKQNYEEELEEINWCPYCGEGSIIMGDEPCEECKIPGLEK